MSLITTIGLLSVIAAPAAAFWRLPCKSTLVVERADPIVSPGNVSGHVHQIMGGNGFDFEMDFADTQASTCTSCTVHGDFSNYWTPVLYYQHQDGTFEKVDQVGGGLVYYLQRSGPNKDKLQAFPEGFRMISGDPFKRSAGNDFASQAISYNCLDYNKSPGNPETPGFPNYNCPNGLRSQLFFPSCWDGKNLDSADHKSHMSFPIGAYNDGSCPSTHPVHLVSIFFEIIWDTNKFKDMWYGNSQPFVWAMGDPTGYGFHGDFVMGWDKNLLQQAVDECTNDSGRVEDCPVFQLYPDSTAEGCKIASKIDEDIQGPFSQLPGCNPVQQGPDEAKIITNCESNATIGEGKSFFTDLTSSGWAYQGCGTDNYYSRALTGASTSQASMTNEYCVQFCSSKGFSIAGTEYSKECYCGNSIPASAQPVTGIVGNCNMNCAGNADEYCGGSGLLTLYQKCTGSSCTNAGGAVGGSTGSSSSSVVASATSSLAVRSTTSKSSSTRSTSATVSILNPSSASGQTKVPTQSSATTKSTASSSAISSSTGGVKATSTTSSKPSASSDPAWTYLSCHLDTVTPRTLPHLAPYVLNNMDMTTTNCLSYCASKNYALAGTEYAGECWCGNSLPASSTKQDESKCQMKCKGDSSQNCGGQGTLSLYGANANKSVWSGVVKRNAEADDAREHMKAHQRRRARGFAGQS
ncbi:hypothetical protein H2198_009160 [Neophaeococcomyces mojaviensis]|uniref:Uncharacterized protein n=1 Tax=Neophaeococcomyces mojaviensis TaxID=3383035 RepID=A0ACC2ZVA5_9EURO|nr:hypothetical protein H2198_009160 [Knufia sp. JES_112]